MTINDAALIERANNIHFREWYRVDQLIPLADTEQAKKELKTILCRLHHREELMSGNL